MFFLLSLKPFFVWANLLREATLRTLVSWNLSFFVHSCSLCEKNNAEFSVNIVWGNSRKATSANVLERSCETFFFGVTFFFLLRTNFELNAPLFCFATFFALSCVQRTFFAVVCTTQKNLLARQTFKITLLRDIQVWAGLFLVFFFLLVTFPISTFVFFKICFLWKTAVFNFFLLSLKFPFFFNLANLLCWEKPFIPCPQVFPLQKKQKIRWTVLREIKRKNK